MNHWRVPEEPPKNFGQILGGLRFNPRKVTLELSKLSFPRNITAEFSEDSRQTLGGFQVKPRRIPGEPSKDSRCTLGGFQVNPRRIADESSENSR